MPVSPSKRAANDRWDAAHMSVITIKARREEATAIKAAAASAGVSTSAYIKQAIRERMERER